MSRNPLVRRFRPPRPRRPDRAVPMKCTDVVRCPRAPGDDRPDRSGASAGHWFDRRCLLGVTVDGRLMLRLVLGVRQYVLSGELRHVHWQR